MSEDKNAKEKTFFFNSTSMNYGMSATLKALCGVLRENGSVNKKAIDVMTALLDGKDIKTTAEQFGLTKERVKQIIRETMAIIESMPKYKELKVENKQLKDEITLLLAERNIASKEKEHLSAIFGKYGLSSEVPYDMMLYLTSKVDDLGIKVRTKNVCKREGLSTLLDVFSMTRWQFASLQHIGVLCVQELDDIASKHGLRFGMNPITSNDIDNWKERH